MISNVVTSILPLRPPTCLSRATHSPRAHQRHNPAAYSSHTHTHTLALIPLRGGIMSSSEGRKPVDLMVHHGRTRETERSRPHRPSAPRALDLWACDQGSFDPLDPTMTCDLRSYGQTGSKTAVAPAGLQTALEKSPLTEPGPSSLLLFQ